MSLDSKGFEPKALHVKIDRKALLLALRNADKAAVRVRKKDTAMPVLAHVTLRTVEETLVVGATNLFLSVVSTLPVLKLSDGACTVMHKQLLDFVRTDTNERLELFLAFEGEKGRLTIKGKTVFMLDAFEYEQFPDIIDGSKEGIDQNEFIQTDGARLHATLTTIMPFVSTDETRPYLNSAYFESVKNGALRLAATDGHRMCHVDMPVAKSNGDALKRLLPLTFIKAVHACCKKVDLIDIRFTALRAVATVGHTRFIVRNVEAKFPDYQQTIPKEKAQARVLLSIDEAIPAATAMVNALKATHSKTMSARFTFRPESLTIEATRDLECDAKQTLEYSGEPNGLTKLREFGINAIYWLEALVSCKEQGGQLVSVELRDNLDPFLITPVHHSAGLNMVVMPMRI